MKIIQDIPKNITRHLRFENVKLNLLTTGVFHQINFPLVQVVREVCCSCLRENFYLIKLSN